MKVRRRARALALQTLYEVDLVHHQPEEVLEQRLSEDPLPEPGVKFARQLVHGVLEKQPALDVIVAQIAPEWPVEQLACIDRNILRMAIFELTSMDTPMKVVINEAVELAKRFGSDSSRRFINGALGTFVSGGMAASSRAAKGVAKVERVGRRGS